MGIKFGLFYNNGIKYLIRFIWYAICGVVFWRTYVRFRDGPEYVYLHQILGTWLCIARGSAAVINLNCAIILLPMCQALVRFLYYSARKIYIDTRWYTINTKAFHIFIGYILLIMTGVHVIAHVFNVISLCDNLQHELPGVNPLPKNERSFFRIVFTTMTGITGVIMILILLALLLTSLQFVRRRSFNLFWYSHRLFIVFYILLVIHGHNGPLRKQLNTELHRPGCIQETGNFTSTINATKSTTADNISSELLHTNHSTINQFDNINTPCSAPPEFGPIGCQTWIWLCVPLFLYFCDMVCRVLRRSRSVEVSHVKAICDGVIEISLVTDGMKLSAGQHVFINCNQVSSLEWHPFSIVQVPCKANGNSMKLWIKSTGDWTERFASSVLTVDGGSFSEDQCSVRYPHIKVDGPYCSTMQQVSQYKVAVCIAGGVGVTPFLSHLIYLAQNSTKSNLQCIHVVCVARDVKLLTNIASIVNDCITKLRSKLEVHCDIYYTGENGITDQKNQEAEYFKKGRPDFPNIFTDLRNQHKRKTIGVFACGPPAICKTVKTECNEQTGLYTKLIFYKETF